MRGANCGYEQKKRGNKHHSFSNRRFTWVHRHRWLNAVISFWQKKKKIIKDNKCNNHEALKPGVIGITEGIKQPGLLSQSIHPFTQKTEPTFLQSLGDNGRNESQSQATLRGVWALYRAVCWWSTDLASRHTAG